MKKEKIQDRIKSKSIKETKDEINAIMTKLEKKEYN